MNNHFSLKSSKTDEEVRKEKQKELLAAVELWGSYWRSNPERFCEDFLNLKLKTFQKILLHIMMWSNVFSWIASRGLGKSFLVAIYCTVRCILYPGSRICIAAKVLKQSTNTLQKITTDLMVKHDWGSELLKNEIKSYNDHGNEPKITFWNTSIIQAVVANENARSFRSNINIYDEFVQMDKSIISTVLDKFLTSPRDPGYLNKPEYSHLAEENKSFYMSSAWYKRHWSFDTIISHFKMMFTSKGFTCCIPYQAGIKEGIILPQTIMNEYAKHDFNEITFAMEYEGIFFGATGEEFYSLDDIAPQRRLEKCHPPLNLVLANKAKVSEVRFRCKRILSVDVALMASTKKKKNDASSIIINDCIATPGSSYIANFSLLANYEGLTTDELGMLVMRYFYKYKCTDIALDTNGVGLGIYDYIIQDRIDPETGDFYGALTCLNDQDMAARCKVSQANRVVWSIKANQKFNSDAATMLRNGFKQENINLLIEEFEAEELLLKDKLYKTLSASAKMDYLLSYINTTLAIHELINLDYEITGTNIKLKEKSKMRKDRYSSMSYSYYVMKTLEMDLSSLDDDTSSFVFKARQPKKDKSIFS